MLRAARLRAGKHAYKTASGADCHYEPRRTALSWMYEEHGSPEEVLRARDGDVAQPGSSEITVDWLAAPINPSDINQVQGKYPIRPQLPAIPGNEGVGVARSVGQEISGIAVGDRVVAALPGLGTWCEAGSYAAAALHRIPAELPLEAAACAAINPPTALRLLEDAVDLCEGDVIVQNGANSAVGQLVIQIAAHKGLRTVNVVRDRPDLQELKQALYDMGASLVTTEMDLRNDFGGAALPKPRLALNCVGGKSSAAIAGLLGNGGVILTYGGMSMQPLQVPTGSLIFKAIEARGFWLSGGNRRSEADVRADLDRVSHLFQQGVIRGRCEYERLEEALAALGKPKRSGLATKTVLLTRHGRQLLGLEET